MSDARATSRARTVWRACVWLGLLTAAASLTAACPRPRMGDASARTALTEALARGDTLALFRIARDVYRRFGVEFDSGLSLELHRPDTLSSYYREDGNRIVLASASAPDSTAAWPEQLRALSTALRFAAEDGFPPGLTGAEARLFVSHLVLLLAAHEQAHYLRAQHFGVADRADPHASEALANRFAVAVLRHLARTDVAFAASLARMHETLRRLLALAPDAVTAYPPRGEAARDWFNRYYSLLLQNEPGVYFVWQLRWWLQFLERPPESLGTLVETQLEAPARAYLDGRQQTPGVRVRVETTAVVARRLASEVVAVGPRGELLVDAGGSLVRLGPERAGDGPKKRVYKTANLPYGEGHRSNDVTWPRPSRLYAAQAHAPETLVLHALDLDDTTGVARAREVGRVGLGERFRTLTHDTQGALYALCESATETVVYRLEPEASPLRATPWRRFPRRPAGHRDGPVSDATFSWGGFAVLDDGQVAFADPAAYALRALDDNGVVTTLFGSLRGRRDGGPSARTTRPSHLAPHEGGFYFVESRGQDVAVRRVELQPQRWQR